MERVSCEMFMAICNVVEILVEESKCHIDKDEATNIVSEGFPQEYTVKIPSNIVINSVQFIVKDGENTYRIEKYQLKFGGYLLAIYDVGNNKLQGLQAKAPAGMKTNVNPKLQIITFVSDGTIM